MPIDLHEEPSKKLNLVSDLPSDTFRASLKSPEFDLATMPRVYLDTAPLMRFADGKEPSLADSFRKAFSESGAVLVLSEGHLMDLSRAEDLSSVLRVLNWVDELPRKVFAQSTVVEETQMIASILAGTNKPQQVELRLEPIDSFEWHVRTKWAHFMRLRVASQFLPMMTNCMQILKRLLADTSMRLPLHRQEKWGLEFISILERGCDSRLIEELKDACERYGIPIAPLMGDIGYLGALVDIFSSKEGMTTLVRSFADRAGMNAELQDDTVLDVANFMKREGSLLGIGAKVILSSLRAQGGSVKNLAKTQAFHPRKPIGDLRWAAVKGGNDRWLQEAPSVAPSLYLGACLALERMKETGTPYRVSDWADDIHVGFVPYVDIATLDKANAARLSRAVALIRARGPVRSKIVVGNSRMAEAISAIATLQGP